VLLGLAIQPFFTALFGFVAFVIIDYVARMSGGRRSVDPADAAVGLAVGGGIAGTLVTVLAALPILMWLLKKGPLTRKQVLRFGIVLGNVPVALILISLAASRLTQGPTLELGDMSTGATTALFAILFGSTVGVASAALFWWLAGRHLGPQNNGGASVS
jgi:hypothetical protein